MWQLMLCLLTANIVPAMITALIQNIQELMVPVSGLELGKKEYVSATGLGETKRSLLPRGGERCRGPHIQLFSVQICE